MKLYIKQKVFSLTSKFTVKDEAGNDLLLDIELHFVLPFPLFSIS